MKKVPNFLSRLFGLFVVIASLFMSCNLGIGLGEDVDTTAPTADIEYPPSSAVIRGTFLLAGSCEDDKGLKEILVTVRNPENPSQSYGPYSATIDASQKTWSIMLNQHDDFVYVGNNGWEYLDGKYEVIVVAYDKAGRDSGERSRTFEIDNTAPFFVISNPGVVKKQNKDPSTFGSVFNIEGTIADDHTVSTMSVDIFNSDGEKITTEPLVEESISTAGGTTVTFAKYSDTADAEVNKRYKFVYEAETAADDKGTKSYYCSVSLSDSAKLYTKLEDAEGVGPGNTTSNVYLYDSVYSTLISSKNGGLGLSAADLNKIYNRTEENENALLLLQSSVINTSESIENALCFTLNPQANPTYTVSGLTFDYSGENLQKMSPNQTMTIALNAGLDNTNVDPATVKVWMLEYSVGELKNVPNRETVLSNIEKLAANVKNLETKEADEKEKLTEGEYTSKFVAGDKVEGIGDWLLLYNNDSYNGATVSSTTVSVTIPAGKVDLGNYYVIAVTGYDADKIEFMQDTVYGFEGNTEGVPPTTVVASPAANTFFACSDDIVFQGTSVLSKAGIYINGFKASITRTNEDNPDDIATISGEYKRGSKNEAFKGCAGIKYDEESTIWTVTPKDFPNYADILVEKNKGASYTYSLEFEATSSSGHSAIVSRLVHIDTIAPVVELTEISPTVTSDGKTNINGKIKIVGRVNEVNLDHVDYETWVNGVKVTGEGLEEFCGTKGKASNFTIELDTTKLPNESNFVLKVIAYDTQNNVGSITSTDYYKTKDNPDGTILYIDQETDRPKFEFNNIELITDDTPAKDQIRESHNLFGTKSNYKLSFAVTDDKALNRVVVKLYDKDGNLINNPRYAEDSYFDAESKIYTLKLAGTTASCQYSLPEKEGDYKVQIDLYDNTYDAEGISDEVKAFRKNTTGIFNVAVDSGAPSIFLTKPREGSYETANVTAEGTVTKSKGVTITAKIENTKDNPPTEVTFETPLVVNLDEETKVWTNSFSLPAEGNYKLTYTAVDSYQQTAEVSTNIIVDNTPPTFKYTRLNTEDVLNAESFSFTRYTNATDYKVTLQIDDNVSTNELPELYYFVANSASEPEITNGHYSPLNADGNVKDGWNSAKIITIQNQDKKWKAEATISLEGLGEANADGSYNVYVVAIDGAGNYSTVADNKSKDLLIIRDNDLPEIETPVANPDFVNKATYDNLKNHPDTHKYTISAKVTDAPSGVDKVTLWCDNKDLNLNPEIADDVYTFTVPADVITTGLHTFTVKATDKAENTKEEALAQSFDITNPEVEISGIESQVLVTEEGVDVEYVNGKIKVSGTAKDETKLGEGKIADGKAALNWNIDGDTTTDGCFGSVELSGISKNWSFVIDTTKVADGEHTINVTVKDAANNVSTTATKTIKVNQDTDTPVLNLTSADTTVTDYSAINDGVKNVLTTTGKLTGTISDDDGIDKVIITVKPDGKTANTPIEIPVGGSTNYSLNKSLKDLGITAENGYKITVKVVDTKDETSVSTKETTFVIAVDNSDPVFSEVTPSDGGYYKDNFAVVGKIKDASGIVRLVAEGKSTNYATETEVSGVATAKEFTDTIDISELVDDVSEGYTVVYTATDRWGKSTSKEIKYFVDTTAPVFQDGESGIKGIKGTEKLTGTWFNGSALDILGYFTDTYAPSGSPVVQGSGVSSITYTVTKKNGEQIASSEISPAYGLYTINEVTNTKAYRYNSTISGFEECTELTPYTLSIVAKDKAGNATSPIEQTILIDQTAPKALVEYYSYDDGTTKEAVSGTVLSNKKYDLTVFGKVNDDLSGLAETSFKLGSKEFKTGIKYTTAVLSDKDSYPTDPDEWQDYDSENAKSYTGFMLTIPKTDLSSNTFTSNAKDKAGNISSIDSFNIVVDETKPTISFTEITDADGDTPEVDVNKDLVLSGIASDNYSLKSVNKIEYKVATWNATSKTYNAYGSYSDISTLAGITGTYSWKTGILDTTKTPFEDNTKVTFKVTAVDTAENENVAEKEVLINQNSDKPVITITTLDGTSDDIISSQTIIGTVRDDDGIETFKYSTDGSDWKDITITSGSWKIENLSAGQNKIYFQIKDKAGTTFQTGETDKPYIVYGSDTTKKIDNTTEVSFKIDLKAPVISTIKVASTTGTTQLTADSKVGEGESATSVWSDKLVSYGKDSKYMWIYAEVSEDVAVNDASVNKDKDVDATITVGDKKLPSTTKIVREGDIGEGNILTYIVGPFDVSTIKEEGTKTVTLTVTDKSGRTSSAKTATVYIDKTAPVVTVTSPNVTDGESAEKDAIVGTTLIRGQITDSSNLSKFYYMIPNSTEKATISDANYKFKASDGWIDIAGIEDSGEKINVIENRSSALWQIPVTSSAFTKPETGLSLVYYATAKAGEDLTYAKTIPSSTDVYVPVYFYAEDVTGQGEVTSVKLRVDPVGGIPTINIITPDNFAKTGGNVNVQGTASDDAGDLDTVTIKIEISTTEITGADSDAKLTNAKSINDWVTVTKAALEKTGVLDTTTGTAQNDGTILATKASNFKFSVALTEIPDETLVGLIGSSGTNESGNNIPNDIKSVRITTVATDTNGTTNSDVNYRYISVDKNAPVMSNIQLVQYETTPAAGAVKSTATTVSRAYTPGMYISNNTGNGNWYLKATVTDDASVNGIKITSPSKNRTLAGKIDANGTTNIICDGVGTKELTFIIPLDTDTTTNTKTQFYPTIELDDGQHTDVTQNLSIFVDNDAPDSTFELKGNGGLNLSAENVVENYDGSFTFSSTLTEEGSGLDFVAYYFKKADGTVYNPAFTTGNSVATQDSKAEGKVYINAEGLPAFYKTEVTRTVANTVSYTGLGSNNFIKPGNLVKINGSYIRIASITGDVATLENEAATSNTTVEFIYAQIIDHEVTESLTTDTSTWPNGVSNDDGDGIAESVKQTGTTYKWSSQIYSDRITDGPVSIKLVVFDKAGNKTSGSVSTSVANNRPRISKVYLATDFNGDGKFNYYSDIAGGAVNTIDEDRATENGYEFGELTFYSTLDSEGKVSGTATVKSTDANFVVTNDLLVMPEIIGGNFDNNGALKYNYRVADSLDDATITKKSDTPSTKVKPTLEDVLSGDTLKAKLSDKKTYSANADDCVDYETTSLQYVDDLLGLHGNTDATNALYKPGEDDTPDAKHTGTYAGLVLNKTTLTPHESWKTESGTETKDTRWFAFTFWDTTSGTTQGESSLFALLRLPLVINVVDDIAPKATIRPMYWNSKDDSTFCYDDNDQPLGHIDIPTKSTEKVGISGQVYIEGYANDESKLKTITVVAPEYKGDAQKFVIAEYVDGNWVTGSDKNASDVAYKSIWNWPENWKDSEILSESLSARKGHSVNWRVVIDMTKYGLGNGTFGVEASDTKPNTATFDAKKVTSTTEANLTSRYDVSFVPYIKTIYPATASSANRSRLGKFPVQAGQPMIIEGMNFGSTTVDDYTVTFKNSAGTVTETGTVTAAEVGKITVTAPNYSRWVEVTIGGQTTQNNTNVNDGYNIEAGYNPKKADKGFDDANKAGTNFWTDDRYISVWYTGTKFANSQNPIMGSIERMSSSMSKYEATNLRSGFAEGTIFGSWGGEDNVLWDEVLGRAEGFGYEKTHTCNPDKSTDIFYSPPQETDICIVNNTIFTAYLDDGWSGSATFGRGLALQRDGEKPVDGKTFIEPTKNDMVRHQFKSVKVAGSYTGDKYHMYVVYYDSYTKCLKYAKALYKSSYDQNCSLEKAYFNGTASEASYVIAGTDRVGTGIDSGTYCDVKVNDNGIPVVVYYYKYSGDNGKLAIAKPNNVDPGATGYAWESVSIDSPSSAIDFGRFVSIEMDKAQNIHIAAQDVTHGVLYYGCFSQSGTAIKEWTKVDATDTVGRWTDIKLEVNTTGVTELSCKPVITYMSQTKLDTNFAVKIAYVENEQFEAITDTSKYQAKDMKLSLVCKAREVSGTTAATLTTGSLAPYAIGINAEDFAIDYLRGETAEAEPTPESGS